MISSSSATTRPSTPCTRCTKLSPPSQHLSTKFAPRFLSTKKPSPKPSKSSLSTAARQSITTTTPPPAANARGPPPPPRQSDYRRNQLELVQKYVDGHQCRMAALVLHFGDIKDGQARCGLCDFCSPSESSAQQYREASRAEEAMLRAIVDGLRGTSGKSLGRLLKEVP